ncbi:MAG: radical SAM protein [Campylobacter sp.]|nr:radical SAM protein [Campylobacter sp.]
MNRIYKFPSYVQRFKRGDKIVFINSEIPAWLVTNELGEIILNLFDGKNSLSEIIEIAVSGLGENLRNQIQKFCDNAINSGIFNEKIKEIRHKYPLHIVHLALTEKCNLKCKYCYVENRKETSENYLNLNEYRKIIDDILDFAPNCTFNITGGEPLLNKNWKEIASYIKSKGAKTWLLSNGTFFSENNIKDIKELFDNVSVSIDGSEAKFHNLTRGRNFNKVINAVNLMEKYGVNYGLSMTVCKTNIADVENSAKKYGSKLKYQPLFPVSDLANNELSITGSEYYEALQKANGVVPLANYENMLQSAKISKCHKCAMGDGEISISADGNVYPCQLLHDEKFLAGNIREQNIIDIYKNSEKLAYCQNLTVDKIDGCKICAFKYICGGACRARSFYEVGNIAKNGDFCIYEKTALLDGIIKSCSDNLLEMI